MVPAQFTKNHEKGVDSDCLSPSAYQIPGKYHLDSGANYGLGTIGTYLGPPCSGGPPSDQKKENPMITVKKGIENYKNGGFLFVNHN